MMVSGFCLLYEGDKLIGEAERGNVDLSHPSEVYYQIGSTSPISVPGSYEIFGFLDGIRVEETFPSLFDIKIFSFKDKYMTTFKVLGCRPEKRIYRRRVEFQGTEYRLVGMKVSFKRLRKLFPERWSKIVGELL